MPLRSRSVLPVARSYAVPATLLVAFTVIVMAVAAMAAPAAGALGAAAPPPAQVAEDLADDGTFVQQGAADAAAVSAVAAEVARSGSRWGLVVLGEEAPGGATIYAERVLDELVADGSPIDTVVVHAPLGDRVDVGAVSDVYSSTQLDSAIGPAADALRSDPAAGFAAYYSVLANQHLDGLPGELAPAGATGGSGFPWVLFGMLALLIGGVLFVMWRAKRSSDRAHRGELDAARTEIRAQISAMADSILTLDPRVTLAEATTKADFAAANATYSEVLEHVDAATSKAELAELAARMDHARWQIACVEADLDGRPRPAEPQGRPAACFFDPTHGAGTEEVQLRTAAGDRPVGVCPDCKARLERGEQPEPRMIDVGGRRLPAPSAPRSSGGQGFDLGDAFQIILGGMAIGGFGWGGGGSRSRMPRYPAPSGRGGGGVGGAMGGGVGGFPPVSNGGFDGGFGAGRSSGGGSRGSGGGSSTGGRGRAGRVL